MPSTSGAYDAPVGLFVFVTIAATSISVLLTPGAVTGTFVLRSAALPVDVGPPDGSVVSDDLLDPAFPHAAAIRTTARPATTMRAPMLPRSRAPSRVSWDSGALTEADGIGLFRSVGAFHIGVVVREHAEWTFPAGYDPGVHHPRCSGHERAVHRGTLARGDAGVRRKRHDDLGALSKDHAGVRVAAARVGRARPGGRPGRGAPPLPPTPGPPRRAPPAAPRPARAGRRVSA